MHLRSLFIIVAGMALLALAGCKRAKSSKANRVTTEIKASVVNAIEVHDGITVRYIQSKGDAHIKVVSHKDYAQQLNVRVEGTKLIAAFKPGSRIPTSGIEVELMSPSISNITASDAATVVIGEGTKFNENLDINLQRAACVKSKNIKCYNLNIEADAASQVQFASLNCNNIKARATQSAAIYLDGHAYDVQLFVGSRSTIRYDKLDRNSLNTTPINETPAQPKKKAETPKAKPDTTKNKG